MLWLRLQVFCVRQGVRFLCGVEGSGAGGSGVEGSGVKGRCVGGSLGLVAGRACRSSVRDMVMSFLCGNLVFALKRSLSFFLASPSFVAP